MLRESSIAFGHSVDVRSIRDRTIDSGIPGGEVILNLVDAVYSGQPADRERRVVIDELGPESFVDACAVYGNFSMMNRVAEATGIPIPAAGIEREIEIVETLGLRRMLKSH